MRTRLMIMAIVLAAAIGAIAVLALLVVALGWLGLAIGAVGTAAILGVYRLWVQPWQHRWGATDEEVHRAMPGDDLIPTAASTTRAIAIAAPPEQVLPWLVQLGYGRAGWYPRRLDRPLHRARASLVLFSSRMLNGREVDPRAKPKPRAFFDCSWAFVLVPEGEQVTRLLVRSRIRMVPAWALHSAGFLMLGDTVMQRAMLRGIKQRVERTTAPTDPRFPGSC